MKLFYAAKITGLAVVFTLLSNLSAWALADLTPYQPSGWSDKIVVSTTTGTSTDSSPLAPTDTLYVDWAVINNGDSNAVNVVMTISVDGVVKANYSPTTVVPSSYIFAQDLNIGSLSSGSHTVTITADSTSVSPESNEANNSYTKNITVGASPLPNLTPYQPAGWSDKVVVSTNTGTTTDSPVLAYTNTLYVGWAITNSGNSTANNFVVTLAVDGAVSNYWVIPALAAGTFTNFVNYSIGSLAGGSHTITITADASNNVAESSESDNAYTKNISVISPSLPNLAPYALSGWSDKVVVSVTNNGFTSNHAPTSTNTLYVDWAVINNGLSTAGASVTTLYVDGIANQTWNLGSIPVNAYTYVTNYVIGPLSVGTHTVSITADSGGTVPELSETDNSFTNTFTISAVVAPAPTLVAPANASTGQATAPLFNWSAVPNVTGYRIIVATNAADLPTDPTATNGGSSVVINAASTTNGYNTVPINPGITYYWEVHSRYNGVEIGTWSSVYSFTTAVTMSGLVIIPSFDSTITSDPQAATIESTINAAIAVYEADFTDPVTVHLTFKEMGSGLGESQASKILNFSYTSYRAALASHATSADDTAALASLPNTSANPVNGNVNVVLKLPLARALGFSANPDAGQPDGTVSLNTSLMNLSSATSDPSKYALFSVVSHEMDEMLGMDTILNDLTNGAPAPTGAASPMDLFRYDGTGARSFTTASNAASYFSLNGTTDLARFNQYQGGDYQDFYSYYGGQTPEVQDAFGTPGSAPVLGVELRVLDALGFTRAQPQNTIVASAGSGGSVSPTGTFNTNTGSTVSFTAAPDATHFVSQWLLDSVAVQNGGSNYTLVNIQANHSVQVTFLAKTNQTITFDPLPAKAIGEPAFTVTATASSSLPVSFSILSGPATISTATITLTNTGTVTVQASQAGNTNYNAAVSTNQSFIVYARPGISTARAGTNYVLSWYTNVAGFGLYSSTNLVAGGWTAVVPSPVNVNGQYVVSNGISGAGKFYRLMK